MHTINGQPSYNRNSIESSSSTTFIAVHYLQQKKTLRELTPVLTNESIIRSFRASVSPPFILIRFLSKHFIAYLIIYKTCLTPTKHVATFVVDGEEQISLRQQLRLHLASVSLPTAIHFTKATSANDSVYAEVIHGQLNTIHTPGIDMTRIFYFNSYSK
jgi:hypothetical protein